MATEPPKIPQPIQIVIEQTQEIPPAPEYTIEEKIKLNVNNCNTDVQWISAEDASCIPKRIERRSEPIKNASHSANNGANTYSPGYCTWYVKNQLSWVPNGWGNANRWASNARSQGYTVSTTPAIGSVAQTSSGSLGHVAVVVAINGETVTITEMNHKGRYVTTTRTLPTSTFIYIY